MTLPTPTPDALADREMLRVLLEDHFAAIKGTKAGASLDELGISRALLSIAGHRAEESRAHWLKTQDTGPTMEEDIRAMLWVDGFVTALMVVPLARHNPNKATT